MPDLQSSEITAHSVREPLLTTGLATGKIFLWRYESRGNIRFVALHGDGSMCGLRGAATSYGASWRPFGSGTVSQFSPFLLMWDSLRFEGCFEDLVDRGLRRQFEAVLE